MSRESSDRKEFRRIRTHLLSSEAVGIELPLGAGQVLMGTPVARPTRFRAEPRTRTVEPALRALPLSPAMPRDGVGGGDRDGETRDGQAAAAPTGCVSLPESTLAASLAGAGVSRQMARAAKHPKLAIFCNEPQAGAVGQYVAALAPACAAHGVGVHIFSRQAFDCGGPEVTIHVLGKDPESGLLQGAEDFTARARAAFTEALAAEAEEVTALCHEWTCIGVLTELQSQGVRAILSLHSLECQRSDMSSEMSRSIQEVERLGLEAATSILVHAQATADAVHRLLPACFERTVQLRRPFPAAEFDSRLDPGPVKARYQVGPVDPMILFVGSLDERHGPDILMKSVPAVLKNHPQARFVFVGDGTLQWPLRVYSRYLLLDHAVRFAGHLEGQPLRELIQAADIVAVPSRERTGEWQVLAAWAAERAVVATHSVGGATASLPSARALVDHERDGVLVYPHESSFVWGLERLLYDHDLRQKAGLNGRRKLLARFGQDSAARQIEELMGVQ